MISRFVFRRQSNRERQASCLMIVIGMIIIGVFAVTILDLKIEPPQIPLLAPASSLVQFSEVPPAQAQTTTPILIPKELFGSEVHTLGIYHQAVGNLPAESVVTILVKDNWRFAEITQRPGRSLAQELSEMKNYPPEAVQLGPLAGVILDINPGYVHCIDPRPDGSPGLCLLTHRIVFEMDNQLISIAGSQQNITVGELIELTRSLIEKPPVATDDSSLSPIAPETEAAGDGGEGGI